MVKAGRFAAERYLLDSLNRIAKNQAAYSVLYVNVSRLKPKNRHPEFVKVMARLFDDLVGAADGTLFVLSNSDFAILGKNITSTTVERAVKKLRAGLASDPLLFAQDGEAFTRVYTFPEDFAELYRHIEELMNDETPVDLSAYKYPVEAAQMDGVLEHLNNINIVELVKRQSVIRFEGANRFKTLFQEFFIAVKDLSKEFDRNIDLVANRWLFLYLTQTLDKKTISAFESADIENWPSQIGLNLNLSTVHTPEFSDFAAAFLKDGRKVVAEVQIMDVFNSLNSYFEVRDFLRQDGHKILIDGTSPEMLRMLNIARLEPDLIKIFWNPMMALEENNQGLKEIISGFGAERVILAKCTEESAVRWGVNYGIRSFQGPYIDYLETALIRTQCPDGKMCSAADCLKRRRLLSGAFKSGCRHREFLEKILG